MRDIINSTYSDRIQLGVHGAGDNTLSLFQKAKNMAASSANGYKHVWVVYDTDDFPADHINKTAELCVSESTEETTYHAIWSNQCIELWFLLHFSFMQSDLHRTSYWPKLTEMLTSLGVGEYVKNRTDMYQILLHTWMPLLQMQKSLTKSIKINYRQLLLPEQKYMNS